MSNITEGLLDSNTQNHKKCSLCCRKYEKQNPAMQFNKCQHVICEQCVNNYQKPNRCQVCGITGGFYQRLLITFQQTPGQKITIRLQDNKGKTVQVTIPFDYTFEKLAIRAKERVGQEIQAIVHCGKSYTIKQHGKLTMIDLGIEDGDLVRWVSHFIGGE